MNILNVNYFFLAVTFIFIHGGSQTNDNNLGSWPEGKTPQEIGSRVVRKFLETPHSLYGNTHPDVSPTQITYPDVCTWLGGGWVAG